MGFKTPSPKVNIYDFILKSNRYEFTICNYCKNQLIENNVIQTKLKQTPKVILCSLKPKQPAGPPPLRPNVPKDPPEEEQHGRRQTWNHFCKQTLEAKWSPTASAVPVYHRIALPPNERLPAAPATLVTANCVLGRRPRNRLSSHWLGLLGGSLPWFFSLDTLLTFSGYLPPPEKSWSYILSFLKLTALFS